MFKLCLLGLVSILDYMTLFLCLSSVAEFLGLQTFWVDVLAMNFA